MMKTLFVVCQHGDEKAPYKVINKYFRDKVEFLVANKRAFNKNTRFIKNDLNRVFPGRKDGSYEERLAFKLTKKLKKYKVVLDFHTTTSKSPLFIITTSLSKKHVELINKLNISQVVYMENSIASGHALIDSVNLGISLEVGSRLPGVIEVIRSFIKDYLSGESNKEKEYFAVFDVLKKERKTERLNKSIIPFRLVKKGDHISTIGMTKKYAQMDFYPIMPREKSYVGIFCLMAKKIQSPISDS
jgi:succinylglutamate desuccinylase